MTATTNTAALRAVAPHFQRSINLTYDAGNADYIAGYIPTPRGAEALAAILAATTATQTVQRSHLLHAAYGSGKSLLGLVLSSLVEPDDATTPALNLVLDRMQRTSPEVSQQIETVRTTSRRLLPVLMSGHEGPLTLALTRALTRTLTERGLADMRPRTSFQHCHGHLSKRCNYR